MRGPYAVILATSVLWLYAGVNAGLQGPPQKTVWSGVYTAAQAARGKRVFQTSCSDCHMDDLRGALSGQPGAMQLMGHWEESTLDDLFSWVRLVMPSNAPHTLMDPAYVDAIAYILQTTGLPAGEQELTPDHELLKGIAIWSSKDAPAAPKTGTLVRTVGCLTQAGTAWTLTSSAAPKRSRVAAVSEGPDLERAKETPLGSATIGLNSFPPAGAAHAGHKMEVKGLLVKLPAGDRVSVMSLTMVAERCGS